MVLTPEWMDGCLLLTEPMIRNFCLNHLVQQINTTGNKGNFCDGLIGIHAGYQLSVKSVGLNELISLWAYIYRVHSLSLLSLKQGQGVPGTIIPESIPLTHIMQLPHSTNLFLVHLFSIALNSTSCLPYVSLLYFCTLKPSNQLIFTWKSQRHPTW